MGPKKGAKKAATKPPGKPKIADLKARVTALCAEEKQYFKDCNELYKGILLELQAAEIQLESSISKNKCLEECNAFLEQCDTILKKHEPSRTSLRARKKTQVDALNEIIKDSEKLSKTALKPLTSHQATERVYQPLHIFQNESLGSVDSELLQLGLLRILKPVSHESREHVLNSVQEGTLHLNGTVPEKPTVKFTAKKSIPNSTTIPIEVATMILSNCTLESCVALRQVNTTWYEAFNSSDKILKEILLKRCPWIYPEGDMTSWADCALVFVSRLRSKKWKAVKHLSNLGFKLPHQTLPKTVIANLTEQEVGMKTIDIHNSFNFNGDPQKITETGSEQILEYRNQTFTLPSNSRLPTNPVTHFKHHTRVSCYEPIWFQKTQPLHYKNAFQVRRVVPGCFEVGRFLASMGLNNNGERYYEFYDYHSMKRIQYGPPDLARPVAAYKGVVWCFVTPDRLVPTFVDLENPDKIYYKLSKVIKAQIKPNEDYYELQAMNDYFQSAEFPNLVCNDSSSHPEVHILDLENGTVTLVRSQYKVLQQGKPLKKPAAVYEDRVKYQVGYKDGKFRAVCKPSRASKGK